MKYIFLIEAILMGCMAFLFVNKLFQPKEVFAFVTRFLKSFAGQEYIDFEVLPKWKALFVKPFFCSACLSFWVWLLWFQPDCSEMFREFLLGVPAAMMTAYYLDKKIS